MKPTSPRQTNRPSSTTPVVVGAGRRAQLLGRQRGQHEVTGDVGDDRGEDEDHAAHGRRALLGQVRLRARRCGSAGRP